MSHASSPNTAPSPATPPDASRGLPLSTPYFWFLAGTGSWFMAMGMQSVLFSWLVVGVLKAEAEWVGITQSATMIPAVLLALPGGTLADRYDQRRLLIILHLVASGISAGLFLAVANDWLSIPPPHRLRHWHGHGPGICHARPRRTTLSGRGCQYAALGNGDDHDAVGNADTRLSVGGDGPLGRDGSGPGSAQSGAAGRYSAVTATVQPEENAGPRAVCISRT